MEFVALDLEVEDSSVKNELAPEEREKMRGVSKGRRGTDLSWAVTLLEFAPIVTGGRGPGPQRTLPSIGVSLALGGAHFTVCFARDVRGGDVRAAGLRGGRGPCRH